MGRPSFATCPVAELKAGNVIGCTSPKSAARKSVANKERNLYSKPQAHKGCTRAREHTLTHPGTHVRTYARGRMHTHTHTHTRRAHTHTHTCAHTHTHTHPHMHTHTPTHTFTCAHTHTDTPTPTHTRTHTHTHTHTYIYIYTNIFRKIYTHRGALTRTCAHVRIKRGAPFGPSTKCFNLKRQSLGKTMNLDRLMKK